MSLFEDKICLKNNIKTAEIYIYADNLTFFGGGGYPSDINQINNDFNPNELQTFSTLPGENLIYDIKSNITINNKSKSVTNSLIIKNVSKNFVPISVMSLGKEYSGDCSSPYARTINVKGIFNASVGASNVISIDEFGTVTIDNITFNNFGVVSQNIISSCGQTLKGTKNVISDLLSKSSTNPQSFLVSKIIITYIECK